MNARMKYIVEMVVAIYFCAYLLPGAISALVIVNTTNWPSGVPTLITTFVPIITILGIALLLMPPEIKDYVR